MAAETLGGETRGSKPAIAHLIEDGCPAVRPIVFDTQPSCENAHPLDRGAGAAAGL
jgi:hypothetical protein